MPSSSARNATASPRASAAGASVSPSPHRPRPSNTSRTPRLTTSLCFVACLSAGSTVEAEAPPASLPRGYAPRPLPYAAVLPGSNSNNSSMNGTNPTGRQRGKRGSGGGGRSNVERLQRILRGNDARHYGSLSSSGGINNSRASSGAGISNSSSTNSNASGKVNCSSSSASSSASKSNTNTCTLDSVFGNDFGSKMKMPGRGGAAAAPSAPSSFRTAPQTSSSRGSSQQQEQLSTPTFFEDEQQSSSSSVSNRARTKEKIDSFLTRESRQSFIARVYAILSAQLAATALSIFAFGTHPEWTRSLLAHSGRLVPMLSLGMSTIAWFWVCGSERARRSSPMKWQLLTLFTIGEALSVGLLSSLYKFRSVLSAMTTTAAATLSITLYTLMNTDPKYDLSQWGSGLASAGMIFLLYALIHVFEVVGWLPQGFLPYSEAIFSFLGAVLFSFYLAYDTRLIVAGKHTKYRMNEKDYVFGAMSIYLDIINLFIYILRLIGEDRD